MTREIAYAAKFWRVVRRNMMVSITCLISGSALMALFYHFGWRTHSSLLFTQHGQAANSWQNHRYAWRLPEGMTPKDAGSQHSIRNFLSVWNATTPPQVAFHRGLWSNVDAIPENSLTAMQKALELGSIVEIDALLTKDGTIVIAHDLTAYRTTDLGDRWWDEMTMEEIEGGRLVVWNVQSGNFTTFIRTGERVVTLGDMLEAIFAIDRYATVLVDIRGEREAAAIVAWLSHQPRYLSRVALLFYAFGYRNGSDFTSHVDASQAASNWRGTVQLIPVVYPTAIPLLASYENPMHTAGCASYEALFTAGKNWIDSMAGMDMTIVSFLFMMGGAGADQNNRVFDKTGGEVSNQKEKEVYYEDGVSIALSHYVRKQYPNIRISSATRTYMYKSGGRYYTTNSRTGKPIAIPTDATWEIYRQWGTPGNAFKYADLVISDRPVDDISAAVHTTLGLPFEVDFEYPPLNSRF